MSLDNKKVKEIAHLARLNIEDSEIEQATAAVSYTHLTLPTKA